MEFLLGVMNGVSAVIASLGGGAVMVFMFSSWLGKIWARKFIEAEKAKYTKEIEAYKAELTKEIDKINSINEKALYISKAQYDHEAKIYQEIWEKMHECVMYSLSLAPIIDTVPVDKQELKKVYKERYSKYAEAFNQYTSATKKYAPFYRKEFYDAFIEIRAKCGELGIYFEEYYLDIFEDAEDADIREVRKSINTISKELTELQTKLQEEIREYLRSLQVYN